MLTGLSTVAEIIVLIKQVCTHGLVSFGLPITSSSRSIPRGTGPPFIAVNWLNFSTNNNSLNIGRVYYTSERYRTLPPYHCKKHVSLSVPNVYNVMMCRHFNDVIRNLQVTTCDSICCFLRPTLLSIIVTSVFKTAVFYVNFL